MRSKDLQIGLAGEYIAIADLLIMGLTAYPTDQGMPYDLIIDNGSKLLKCQVKTTSEPREIPQRSKTTLAYIFNIKRHGKKNKKRYGLNEIDIFALVELQNRTVVYLKNEEMPDTINIRVDELKGTYYDEKGAENYQNVIELRKKGLSQTEISKKLGLHISQVNRICKEGYKPHKTKAKYWSDYKRNLLWFKSI